MRNRGLRGYFYPRLLGCLIGASLLAGGFLLSEGVAAGAHSTSNYDAAYTTTTQPTTTPTTSPPANTSPPTISGTLSVGSTLTAKPGDWTNNPTSFSYQWAVCNASGVSCTAIPGATGSTYNLGSSDVGHTIRTRPRSPRRSSSSCHWVSSPRR